MAEARRKGGVSLGALVLGGFVVCGLLWLFFSIARPVGTASSGAARGGSRLSLSLVSTTADVYKYQTSDGGQITVEGQVKNTGDESAEYVQAVVTFYTKAGKFAGSKSSYLTYTTLLAGQTSPFKVIANYNPEISSYTVALVDRNDKQVSLSGTRYID